MSVGTLLLVVVIILLIGVLPTWPHAQSWGLAPTGIVSLVLIVVLILLVLGKL